jgi:hypothetical protein
MLEVQTLLHQLMKPSQNSLFKADTYIRSVAESGILGPVQVIISQRKAGQRQKERFFADNDISQQRKKDNDPESRDTTETILVPVSCP